MLRIVSSKGELFPSEQQSLDWKELFHVLTSNSDLKSWTFSLPKHARNLAVLRDFILLDSPRLKDVSIDVSIELFGREWSRGPLWFIDENPEEYRVSFAGRLGAFVKQIEGKNIRDFSYSDPVISDMYDHAATILNAPGNYDYVFAPVELPSIGAKVWHPAQLNSVLVDQNGDFDRYADTFTVFDAEPYDSTLYYYPGDNVSFNGNFYSATRFVEPNEGPVSTPGKWEFIILQNNIWYVPVVPFFYVLNILETVFDQLGINLKGEIFSNGEIRKLLFFNVTTLNDEDDEGLITVAANTQIIYANHIPDVTVKDLVRELATWFNQRLDFSVNDNSLTMVHRTEVFTNSISSALENRLIRIEVQHKEKRTYNLSSEYNPEDFKTLVLGWNGSLEGVDGEEGSEDISSSFGSLPMVYGFREVNPSWVQYAGDPPLSDKYPGYMWRPASPLNLNDDVPKQFLFWRGLHIYTGGTWGNDPELPQVSSDFNFNIPGSSFQYTTLWKGAGGLYQKWWKPYLDPLSLAKVVKLYIIMNQASFDRESLLKRQFIDNRVYLLEEGKYTVKSGEHEAVAEIVALKL